MRTEAEPVLSDPKPALPRRPHRGIWLLLGAVLGLAVGTIVVVALGGHALITALTGAGDKTTVTESTVVRSIQQLQRLETVVYTLDQVITEERQGVVAQPFAGERILLIAHGDVIAGVDVSQLRGSAVTVHGSSVRVRLPDPQIFTTRLDNQKTRVYSRDTGLFSTPDPELETRVRQRAESQLTAAAVQEGILATARANAKQTLTALLSSLGFQQITVE
jgi:hypothetical protein